ncbi:MAG TPA: C10 family peptidase [Bacteroidia bacterium]|jgi:PKD repeat protein|nr:C10 family peptidase [Bacteroidia bacterium]
MKKIKYLSLALVLFAGLVNANPVAEKTAQTVAVNFYSQTFKTVPTNSLLTYTEYANDGSPVYYVFNIDKGFVIVSAEDVAHPILGYSTEGKYVIPKNNNNAAWWMNCRKEEITAARTKGITATSDIAAEWANYTNNIIRNTHSAMTTYGPLLGSITWDQSPYYNATCPGGSVTGCVATCMAQIMKYWNYPPHGHGSSGYWDEQAYSYTSSYGYLSANYDTSNYVWSAMPNSISANNNEIAKLMYDCGVSVDMDYTTGESGAWVITGDYPVCSQVSFVKYFGYNPATIKGLYQSQYSNTIWTNLIINEIINSRPVQYVGWDSISINNAAGHTWVCDGYNSNTSQFHMNWGWGGSSNGWFALNALNGGAYKFNWWNEALIGIEPPKASPYFVATPTFGCAGMSVQFTDQSFTDSNLAITSRSWLFPGGTPNNSPAANPLVQYNTPGTYDVTEIIGTIRGYDTLIRKAYISVGAASTLPLVQNFQSVAFPPSGWVINNPNNYSYVWQLNTNVGSFGNSTQSMYFNNCQGYQDWAPPRKAGLDIIGQHQQIYTPKYDFTGVTNPKLYFDVAYAPYSNTYSDTLVIYYSTDCGNTFTQIYSKGGMTLGTTGNYVTTGADTNSIGCFLPLSTNWRTDTVHIPAIANVNNVMFSFENRSGNGSPLYIDNINIPGLPAGVPSVSSNPSVKVYPNPSNGQFTFGVNNISGTPYVKIYNVLGQEVFTSQFKNQNTQVNLSIQPKGIYIYRVFSENGASISTGRLVVE